MSIIWFIHKQIAASVYHLNCVAACVVCLLLYPELYGQESILQARQRPAGSVVTIKGIALNGSELGAIRYLQDSTAGIAVYPGGSSPSSFEQITATDEVQVTGVLSTYHGLLEINPILSYQKVSTGNSLPAPIEKDVDALTFHDQGRLVRIRCARFLGTPGYFDAGSHPISTSNGNKSTVYLEGNHPLTNAALPEFTIDLVAIASYYDEVRLLIRSESDISSSDCFHIVPTPVQSQITETGFHVSWVSNETASGFCFVQDEDGSQDTIMLSIGEQHHETLITDLQPAEFYQIQVGAVNATGDSAMYPAIPMTTKSTSSGSVAIYFNKNIDASFSNGSNPDGTSFAEMMTSIMNLIGQAQSSLDIAMYNSNRPDIIFALEQAMQRGVRVRYIGDGGQSNSALDPLPDFSILFRNGDGIMHHKFIIVDPHDPELAVVWTGSTNHSTGQLSSDPNNAIVIQDQALAKAYLQEFEEMWGGSGNSPNPLLSRTGSAKHNDTPHLFQIGDIQIESYFSPSDNTNQEILSELQTAETTIDVGLLLLTRNDLAGAMVDRVEDGVRVRVIVDDLESSQSPIQTLNTGGAFTAHHDYNSIFHHKYAIIDEGETDALVITGSHNWTTSATVRNDENTLIVHDRDIANIYRQEFEARWAEVFSSGVVQTSEVSPVRISPNPATDIILVDSEAPVSSVTISTITGNVISAEITGDRYINITYLPPGLYYLNAQMASGHLVKLPFVKL